MRQECHEPNEGIDNWKKGTTHAHGVRRQGGILNSSAMKSYRISLSPFLPTYMALELVSSSAEYFPCFSLTRGWYELIVVNFYMPPPRPYGTHISKSRGYATKLFNMRQDYFFPIFDGYTMTLWTGKYTRELYILPVKIFPLVHYLGWITSGQQ